MNKKKKTIIITSVVLASFVIIGIVYALLSDSIAIKNKFKVGTVHIDIVNLALKDEDGDDVELWEPADINTISWSTKNIGTSAVLSRHTLEIRWTGNMNFYLYPANMKDSEIIADFQRIQEGGETVSILTEPITETVGGATKIVGLKYNFVSDTLDGTNNTAQDSVSSEVNYNSTVEGKIDSNINTDDSNKKQDDVAFKLLLSPKTSYLNQGKVVSVKVKAEGMQYTTEGSQDGTWVAGDVEEIAEPEGD